MALFPAAKHKLLRRVEHDRASMERIGMRAARRAGLLARSRAYAAWNTTRDIGAVQQAIRNVLLGNPRLEQPGIVNLVTDAMVAGHLQGRRRTAINVGDRVGEGLELSSAYDGAIEFLRNRLDLTTEELGAVSDAYGSAALRVVATASDSLEQAVQQTLLETTQQGEGVRGGITALREAFASQGVTAESDFQLEAIFRTQTQTAYHAGRWESLNDPDLADLVWGFEYVAIRDDRITEEICLPLDGMRRRKEDPVWQRLWPPNHWNCRSTPLEILQESDETEVPDVQAQAGFGFNPGMVFGTDAGRLQLSLELNCGTGAGGFKPGNTCGAEPGGGGKSIKAPKAKKITRSDDDPSFKAMRSGWADSLHQHHKDAINQWEEDFMTASDFRRMGAGESPEYSTTKERTAAFEAFKEAVNAAPSYEGVVFRGLSEVDNDQLNKLTSVGDVITIPSYSSATKDWRLADFYTKQKVDLEEGRRVAVDPQRSVFLKIHATDAADITPVSTQPEHQEVVLRPASRYKVLKVHKLPDGRRSIELQQTTIGGSHSLSLELAGCGANAPGGGGFQPGNTCGAEPGGGGKTPKAGKKATPDWSQEEHDAISSWVDPADNTAIKDDERNNRAPDAQTKALYAAINKAPVYTKSLHRGMTLATPLRVGETLTLDSTTSTTKSADQAETIAKEYAAENGRTPVVLHFEGAKGADLSSHPEAALFDEVVLRKNDQFKVASIEHRDGVQHVTLRNPTVVADVPTPAKKKLPFHKNASLPESMTAEVKSEEGRVVVNINGPTGSRAATATMGKTRSNGDWFINDIVVDESARRQGVGTQVYRRLWQQAQFKHKQLYADINNPALNEFHARLQAEGVMDSSGRLNFTPRKKSKYVPVAARANKLLSVSDTDSPIDKLAKQKHNLSIVAKDVVQVEDEPGHIGTIAKHVDDLHAVPPTVWQELRDHGTKVLVNGKSVGESFTEYKGVRPRGWPEGSTWDQVEGAYLDHLRTAHAGKGESGALSTAIHETGHALAYARNLNGHPKLVESHKRLFNKLHPYAQQEGPGGDAGCKEMFAMASEVAVLRPFESLVKDYDHDFATWMYEVWGKKRQ